MARLLNREFDKDFLWKVAFETDRATRRSPISLLINISIEGGALIFRRGIGVSRLNVRNFDDARFILVHSGREGSETGKMLRWWSIKTYYDNYMDHIVYASNNLTLEIAEALLKRDSRRLGKLLNASHSIIRAVGASTLRADELVTTALRLGATGAKLVKISDGFIVGVVPNERLQNVFRAMEKRSRVVKTALIDFEGVKLH